MNEPESRPEESRRGGLGAGVGLGLLLHVVVGTLAVFSGGLDSETGVVMLACIGLSQLLYMGPAMLIARHKGHAATMKGLALVAAITFLLNAGCWGLILTAGL